MNDLPPEAIHELARLDSTALDAALKRRRHEITCPICSVAVRPCKVGVELRRTMFEAKRAAARRRHELATAN